MSNTKTAFSIRAVTGMILCYGVAFAMLAGAFFFPQIPFWFGLIFTVGFLFGAERSLTDYKQSQAIGDQVFDDTREGASASASRTVAKVHKSFAIPLAIVGGAFMIAVLALYVAVAVIAEPAFDVSMNAFGAPLAFVLHYAFFRKLAGKKIISSLKSSQERNLPQLSVEGDSLIIDIVAGMTVLGSREHVPAPIRIAFSEIQTLKLMNLQEVQAMGEFEIGPDIKLFVQSKKDEFNYFRKAIDRPRAYFNIIKNASIAQLMIQGPDILYVFSVPEEQAKQVSDAWDLYKSG